MTIGIFKTGTISSKLLNCVLVLEGLQHRMLTNQYAWLSSILPDTHLLCYDLLNGVVI